MDEPNEPKTLSVSAVIRGNLRRLREAKGWSQRQLAEELTRRTGEKWSQTRVLDLEGSRGRDRTISPEELAVLCPLYGVSLLDLLQPPEGTRVRVGQDEVTAHVLFYFLRLDPDTDPHFDRQWAWFRDTTLGLFWQGKLTRELLEQAAGGDWVDYPDADEPVWVGPSPTETEQARIEIRDAYLEAEPEIFTEIAGDPGFWSQVRARRPGWGVSHTSDYDDFTELVLRIIRNTEKGDHG